MTTGSFFKSIDGFHNAERLYHRHASIALSVAITCHFMMVTGYYFYSLLVPVQPVEHSGSRRDTMWVLPRFPEVPEILSNASTKSGRLPGKLSHAFFGLPLPTAEPFVDSALESDVGPMEQNDPDGDGGESLGTDEAISSGLTDEVEPSPDNLRFVEKEPIPVRQVTPGYPELARRLSVEGTVWVKILIDKEGHARKAFVIKSENSLLEDSAKAAALRWLFIPAMMNNGPVMVWAAVPFRFRLAR
ncbi:MAG: energy transducer TonB [Ignavibacteriae bacterium]|nr:energy transducer TonB [Ignavibacteria bacterium]MBI3365876.1 energy transducer TonB [Ignavibacteriota bacterium]